MPEAQKKSATPALPELIAKSRRLRAESKRLATELEELERLIEAASTALAPNAKRKRRLGRNE